jgi:hypothetical protein
MQVVTESGDGVPADDRNAERQPARIKILRNSVGMT